MSKAHSNAPKGPSQRQLRVGELIRRALAEIIQRGELHDPELTDVPITVGEVKVSPDLRVATVYVMPLGGQNVKEVIAALARSQGELRHLLGKQVLLKFSPTLRFMPDETFARLDATRRLLADERVPASTRFSSSADVAKPDAPPDTPEEE